MLAKHHGAADMLVPHFTESDKREVFSLRTPADLFRKMFWEYRELVKHSLPDVDEFPWAHANAYRAINFAISAWNLTDWTWLCLTYEQRRQLSDKYIFNICSDRRKNLERFQNVIGESCGALHVCRRIATAFKHCDPHKPDQNLHVRSEWVTVVEPIRNIPAGGSVLTLRITHKDNEGPADLIFLEAIDFWDRLLGDLGYLEGRAVEPSRQPD